jgi:hypothetical protein
VKGEDDTASLELPIDQGREMFQLEEAEVELEVHHIGIRLVEGLLKLVEIRAPPVGSASGEAELGVGIEDLDAVVGEDAAKAIGHLDDCRRESGLDLVEPIVEMGHSEPPPTQARHSSSRHPLHLSLVHDAERTAPGRCTM